MFVQLFSRALQMVCKLNQIHFDIRYGFNDPIFNKQLFGIVLKNKTANQDSII